jgi:ubiquinone/menaquinone biosynthesis C-methylase UbiE
MKIRDREKRLEMFWGKVDRKHIVTIQNFLFGTRILDIGCGYGSTTALLRRSGYDCTGIDNDNAAICAAVRRFPGCRFQQANAGELPFADDSFDTILLRDALHHVYCQPEFPEVRSEILRVAGKKSRIILFDPNINLILKTMRKLSSHTDEECNFETAIMIMKQFGYAIIHSGFNTVYSLPLSGGYVGINFVPDVNFLHSLILGSETLVESVLRTLHLSRYLCWRYIIVGERDSK